MNNSETITQKLNELTDAVGAVISKGYNAFCIMDAADLKAAKEEVVEKEV